MALITDQDHLHVEATWGIYQRMVVAHREPDKQHGRQLMQAVIDSVAASGPAALVEVRKLGRTLSRRVEDVLAYFERSGTTNGPTETIIIWRDERAVFDVVDVVPRSRRRHVVGSVFDFPHLAVDWE